MSIILGCNVPVSCPSPYGSALTALQDENSHWKFNFGIGKLAKFKFLLSKGFYKSFNVSLYNRISKI